MQYLTNVIYNNKAIWKSSFTCKSNAIYVNSLIYINDIDIILKEMIYCVKVM